MARINFVAEQLGNQSLPGVQAIINRLKAMGSLQPETLVTACLDLLGPVEVNSDTRKELTEQATQWGELSWDSDAKAQTAAKRATEMMQLIVATREFQFA
jgi:thioredoxin-like negative regulator of GroEL